MAYHHIFVYGTLKRGLYNTKKMFDPETGVSKFVGMAKTVEKYPFVVATDLNCPLLLDKPGHGKVSLLLSDRPSIYHQIPLTFSFKQNSHPSNRMVWVSILSQTIYIPNKPSMDDITEPYQLMPDRFSYKSLLSLFSFFDNI